MRINTPSGSDVLKPAGLRQSPATGGAERSVLIVDDNPQKTLALQSVVEELNLRAVVASSAEAALRELLRQNFALALLDVHMPRIDGFELAALIRSRPAHQDLPIVFMSAIEHTDERLETAYALGAIDFIVLPARRPIIKAKLAAILGLRKNPPPVQSLPAGDSPPTAAPDRVRLLLDAADDIAIFFVSPAGTIAEWSHAAELCTGWPADEIIGRPFSVLFAPGDVADRFPTELLASGRTGRKAICDRWLVRKDGSRYWARFHLVTLRGQPDAGFGVMLRDASGQKTAEQELQIKAAVLHAMNESMCVLDGALRIIYANPAAHRTFGYETDDFVGMDMRKLNGYSAEEGEARIAALLAHLNDNRVWSGEWQSRRRDGAVFTTHTRVAFFEHEEARYFVCVQEDLAPKKNAEAALQRSRRLEEMLGELEAFSYSVSHDLRSPLRTIRGYADAVIQENGAALAGHGLQYLQRIRVAADRLEQMILDVLAISRVPRDELNLVPVDLAQVLQSILEETPNFRPPHANVFVVGILPVVMGHEPSLRQIFQNLIGNAVKFVPSDRPPVVTVRAEQHGAEARVWIEDNGIGIKPEDHERIFHVFERATSSKVPGTGVGLAIVARAVARMGGTNGVKSELGKGSQFWIQLRCVPALR